MSTTTSPVRWGILATGIIADQLAEALQESPTAVITAVGSRSQASADRFGDKWDIPNRHPTYEALAHDPDVDVIYIATPHSHHYDNMKLCLGAGKHVLCEKAFTLNAEQAAECIALAREKNLFLMEAMWMRFMPAIQQIRHWIEAGEIGDVRLVQANFSFHLPFDPKHRLYNPDLGGGALLDLGIYPLSFTTFLLGMPDEIKSHTQLAATGVDGLDNLLLIYNDGPTASLMCSMEIDRPKEAFVMGTAGTIKVHEPFFYPTHVTMTKHGREPETHHIPYQGNGYIHEVEEVHNCLRAGRLESDIISLDETLALMKIMDGLRAEWGFRYPQEM
jgi:predicted dehydrogenase